MWVGYVENKHNRLVVSYLKKRNIEFDITDNVVYMNIPTSERQLVIDIRRDLEEKIGCHSKFHSFSDDRKAQF